ncbi:MAG: DNA topoisomerase (ATP-hydrolyzing) subunit B [Bacilli bacterium]|jgi:DNA gyrase subunit B|nr:DNA topoisomerase (ATP-hydrolyzing) subunit B [Bacilli bacterium]MCH4210385.1 DNA topoisomerase (ATP-hydrolyzing) subunit B [Bacilli bacterium]MCH4277565.1 DNA topoisomerase (ATP-hydrolyzing) subunit B [Bacilli bacterium]MCI2055117.1 DNA topoisomerase (ATP-hydrolyzing) subunit B [Bacilli bacterium]
MADEEKKIEEAKKEEATLVEAAKESGVSKESLAEEDKFQYKMEDVSNERGAEKADEHYTADNIQVLEGLEAVRKRPGMYIATTAAPGLHHLVWEIVDNSIDEALAGYCTNIEVTINPENSITVQDDGRGIPVDIVAKSGLSGVETAYTILHAGGKFGEGGGYKVSGGLHGVGASVVNALSKYCDVTVHKEGGVYHVRFTDGGKITEHLKKIGTCDDHGTTVTFLPDPEIFTETTVFNYETIKNHLRQMAFLNGGVKITLTDKRGAEPVTDTFLFNGGIREYVSFINTGKLPINNEVIYCQGAEEVTLLDGSKERIYSEIAMQWTDYYNSDGVYSFCNNISTKEGGTHVEGFNLALNRTINDYARKFKLLDEKAPNFTTDDCREGLTCVISVKHPNPQYEGQTKTKLGNSEVRKIVSTIVGDQLSQYLLEHPDEAKKIIEKVKVASKGRMAAQAARETIRKGALGITTLPGKLADCSSKDPSLCELYIVEGNSAGGSAKNGRDRETQAILPLRGKILNVEKAREDRIFKNAEIGNMITAIGAGIRENFDVTKIRYHKIVIMTDADVDGDHIRILLLTFFYRFMRPLIDGGYVYIAQPPLYKIDIKGNAYYAYNDDQLEQLKKALQLKPGYPFQRYKGLGEMDAQQLWETTMDPKARKMIRITIDDATKAEMAFTQLMGDDVEPRKEFISKNAKFVQNLDI